MITDFLKTKRTVGELRTALEILREFRGCESSPEYIGVPFLAWAKFEQLEEFLSHLVDGTELKPDTVAYMQGAGKARYGRR